MQHRCLQRASLIRRRLFARDLGTSRFKSGYFSSRMSSLEAPTKTVGSPAGTTKLRFDSLQ
jgi:hypothetical protein